MKRTLIIVNGHPGSGKTTTAQRLSKEHHIPYVSKDRIKERIFDALGSTDKDWSLKVSAAAHRIMDDAIAQQLQCGGSIIVESNFKPDIDSQRLSAFVNRYGAACVQIVCQASGEVLFERWTQRIADGSRHEGHVEAIGLDEIRHDLAESYTPLDVPGVLVVFDTTQADSSVLPTWEDTPHQPGAA
jgi:predicted kinase